MGEKTKEVLEEKIKKYNEVQIEQQERLGAIKALTELMEAEKPKPKGKKKA